MRKAFQSKILRKALLLFAVILFVIFASASFITTRLIGTVLNERDYRYSQFILVNINDYIQKRFDSVHQLIKLTNMQGLQPNSPIFNYLKDGGDIAAFTDFKRYISSLFSFDTDISSIEVYRISDGQIYFFDNNKTTIRSAIPASDQFIMDLASNPTQAILVRPASLSGEKGYLYTLSSNLKDTITFRNVGVFTFQMNSSGITRLIDSYYPTMYGDFYILTKTGEVIYSSSGAYYGEPFPLTADALRQQHVALDRQKMRVYTYSNNEAGLVVVQLIPSTYANESIGTVGMVVYIALALAVVTTIVFFIAAGRIFSRRIVSVTQCFAKVQSGNLSERIPIGHSRDEITVISESFNQMCDHLQEYIEREYIYELDKKAAEVRLKDTEIKSLQAQINPHFLYNCLEMIRMKAYVDGARDAGDMIMVLSKLMRSSIKDALLVTVDEEIMTAKLFVRLYQMKYSNLEARFDVDPSVLRFAMIRNTIQPVLENSVVHGYKNDGPFEVTISAITGSCPDTIVLQISDNGSGIEPERLSELRESLECSDVDAQGSHIGLLNVHDRVKLIFGDQGRLTIDSVWGMGTTVGITFPKRTIEQYEDLGHV